MRREVLSGALCILFLSLLSGCGSDRRSSAVSADSAQASAAAPAPDTSMVLRDTAPKPSAPKPLAPPVAQKQPTPAAQKPAAPAPESAPPAQPQSVDRPTTPATEPASGGAPLRDQYHQAPLDTVVQVVYDGWKQFNLNCARCHGEDVQGTTIAPHLIVSLRPDGPINTKELFIQTVCAGRPEKGMPSWCALGMEMGKIESIYSYVKGRSEGKIHQGRPAVKPAS
jgi:hypothetical protein